MAIARGAGTEILCGAHFEDVDSTSQILIVGVQHHIYTVLNLIVYCKTINAAGDYIEAEIRGYDSKAGTTNQGCVIFHQDMNVNETYVWNDKFSFNGFEPTDFGGPLDDTTKQDAIADQGSSVLQKLAMSTEHASDGFEVHVSFIDQNNA
jgi:hypothetical protein